MKTLPITLLCVLVFILGFEAARTGPAHSRFQQRLGRFLFSNGPTLLTNEHYVRDIQSSSVNLTDPMSVFGGVFTALPKTVHVYPTENYYYFRFFTAGQEVAGNIRLAAQDRDRGVVYFSYFGTPVRDESPQGGYGGHNAALGPRDGVHTVRRAPLEYAVTFRGKTVTFLLNNLSQTPPPPSTLHANERFVERTFDESGTTFLLLFNAASSHFRFVVDASAPFPDVLEDLDTSLLLGRRTGFAFFRDSRGTDLTLVGVDARNVHLNNFYDGPFDQLADNFIPGELLQASVGAAYPSVRGKIDASGNFLDDQGRHRHWRIALQPYARYESLDTLRRWAATCRSEGGSDRVLACLTRDSQQDAP